MTPLLTRDTDLAEQFGITVEKLHDLRKLNRWPHVRLGRFDIRFTAEQVAQIVALHSVAPAKAADAPTTLPGQTSRSAARRRSA